MSDEQLIKEIRSGNSAAFRTLMERYQQQVFRVAMGYLHAKEDAEDLTQEVFIRVYEMLHTFHGEAAFSTWLYRITLNMSLNQLRKNKKKRLLQSLDTIFNRGSSDKTPLEMLEREEQDREIRAAINALPEKQRMAFVLSRYEELPQKQIATIMNRTEGAVEQLLKRANEKLRKKLQSP